VIQAVIKWFNRTFRGTVYAEDSVPAGSLDLDEYFAASQDLEQEIQNNISKGIENDRQLLP
jgi:hypothetical protein